MSELLINLLDETIEIILQNGKSPDQVKFVQNSYEMYWGQPRILAQGTWAEFVEIACFRYDNSFGGNNISMELKVVGDDWWLERHEYDGSEWWEFKTSPAPFEKFEPLSQAWVRGRW